VKELKTTVTPHPYFWIPDGNTSLTAALLEHKYTNECYYIKLLFSFILDFILSLNQQPNKK
jgi:hypothetical protein